MPILSPKLRRLLLGKSADNRRILVVGSTCDAEGVDAYEWEAFHEDVNLPDYEVILINLSPLGSDDYLLDNVRPLDSFVRFLKSRDTEAIIIGMPGSRSTFQRFLETWLPDSPTVILESGGAIRSVSREFAFYFAHVKRWNFRLMNSETILKSGYDEDIKTLIHPIACNRLNEAIGFRLQFVFLRTGTRSIPAPTIESNYVFWLPGPTEIESWQAVELILKKRYGREVSHPVDPVAGSNSVARYEESADAAPNRVLTWDAAIETLRSRIKQRLKAANDGNVKYDVFISYRRIESTAFAKALARALRQSRHPATKKSLRVFHDIDTLGIGQNINTTLLDAMKQSVCFVILLTPQYTQSDYTKFESMLISAIDAGGLDERIFPVKLAECSVPDRLASINYLDLVRSKNR